MMDPPGTHLVPKHQANTTKVQAKAFQEGPISGRYEEIWKKVKTDDSFAHFLNSEVEKLYDSLKIALAQAHSTEIQVESAVVAEITKFLRDEKGHHEIDSCIRWHMLLHAAFDVPDEPENDPDSTGRHDEKRHVSTLVEIITSCEVYLAFENPFTHQKSDGTIKGACRYPKKHWQQRKKQESTPYHVAARRGNSGALESMIRSIKRYCDDRHNLRASERRSIFPPHTEDLFLHLLKLRDPSDKRTALEYVCQGDEISVETLAVLLKYPRITEHPDTTFGDALDAGKKAVVEQFLKIPELCIKFVTSDNIIKAMNSQSDNSDEEADRGGIVQLLVQHAGTKGAFNDEVIQKIIEHGSMDVWDARPTVDLKADPPYLLHLAVLYQQVRFVERFMDAHPEMITSMAAIPGIEKKQGYYPLWYNNNVWRDSKWEKRTGLTVASKDIRKALVTETIKRTEKMYDLLHVLDKSAEEVKELCFDLSQFNFSRQHPMNEFIQSLISHKEKKELLVYEPTIKYASFPALDVHSEGREHVGKSVLEENTEVFDIMDWLRREKGVASIIELKVPDRMHNPHHEMRIAKYVRKFGVEVLDWRFLDLGLSIFDKVKSNIRELHLYSSGKRAAISHWFSSEGLRTFDRLSYVHIHVIQETMTKKYCENTCGYIHKQLQKLKQEWPWPEGRDYKGLNDTLVTPQLWNPTHERLADLDEIARRAFPKLSNFVLNYRAHVDSVLDKGQLFRPTKIAIIDNGILSISPVVADGLVNRKVKGERVLSFETDDDEDDAEHDHTRHGLPTSPKEYRTLWSRIKEGRSFVDDDYQLSPWLFASHPHGTQMANLICAIDPRCELYVAKVTDGDRYGINPKRLARAIEWAQDRQVDIISMSLSLLQTSENLDEAISNAGHDHIVMMCSSHDLGKNVTKAWPAMARETTTITACDEYGQLLRSIDDTEKYDFTLPGHNVAAGVIPFLESNDRISGSSVSTAIASGLASLILSCARLKNPDKEFTGSQRQNLVDNYLKSMTSQPGSKELLLEKFGNIDAKIKEGEYINAEAIIDGAFSWGKIEGFCNGSS